MGSIFGRWRKRGSTHNSLRVFLAVLAVVGAVWGGALAWGEVVVEPLINEAYRQPENWPVADDLKVWVDVQSFKDHVRIADMNHPWFYPGCDTEAQPSRDENCGPPNGEPAERSIMAIVNHAIQRWEASGARISATLMGDGFPAPLTDERIGTILVKADVHKPGFCDTINKIKRTTKPENRTDVQNEKIAVSVAGGQTFSPNEDYDSHFGGYRSRTVVVYGNYCADGEPHQRNFYNFLNPTPGDFPRWASQVEEGDLLQIVVHEIGHALGLSHSTTLSVRDRTQTMADGGVAYPSRHVYVPARFGPRRTEMWALNYDGYPLNSNDLPNWRQSLVFCALPITGALNVGCKGISTDQTPINFLDVPELAVAQPGKKDERLIAAWTSILKPRVNAVSVATGDRNFKYSDLKIEALRKYQTVHPYPQAGGLASDVALTSPGVTAGYYKTVWLALVDALAPTDSVLADNSPQLPLEKRAHGEVRFYKSEDSGRNFDAVSGTQVFSSSRPGLATHVYYDASILADVGRPLLATTEWDGEIKLRWFRDVCPSGERFCDLDERTLKTESVGNFPDACIYDAGGFNPLGLYALDGVKVFCQKGGIAASDHHEIPDKCVISYIDARHIDFGARALALTFASDHRSVATCEHLLPGSLRNRTTVSTSSGTVGVPRWATARPILAGYQTHEFGSLAEDLVEQSWFVAAPQRAQINGPFQSVKNRYARVSDWHAFRYDEANSANTGELDISDLITDEFGTRGTGSVVFIGDPDSFSNPSSNSPATAIGVWAP